MAALMGDDAPSMSGVARSDVAMLDAAKLDAAM